MKSVNIAKFKAEMGKYLGYVRKGEGVIVLDRKEPLAQVMPFQKGPTKELEVEDASEEPRLFFAMRPGPISGISTDSLEFLKEERGDR